MSAATHILTVTIDTPTSPIVAPVIDSSVTLDEVRQPYAVVSLTVPLVPAMLALNPQASVIPASVTQASVLGRVDTVADLSRRWRSLALAQVSAGEASGTIDAMSAGMYHDYAEPGHAYRATSREFTLYVLELRADEGDATAKLTLASYDARLNEDAHIGFDPIYAPEVLLPQAVAWGLSRIEHDLTSWDDAAASFAPSEGARTFGPGDTLADFLNGMTRSAGVRLWCDELGAWRLRESPTPTPRVHLYGGKSVARSITRAETTISRAQDWYCAVVLTYKWTDAAGETHERRDIATDPLPAPSKPWVQTIERPWPGAGRAQAMLRTFRRRGRALDIEAVSDYSISPGTPVTIHLPDRPDRAGIVSAVTWRTPADEMTLTIRDIEEPT